MVNVRIIENNPITLKLLETFVEAAPDFSLREPAELILLDAREMAQLPNLKQQLPGVKIVVMTDKPEHSSLQKAQALDADGFWYLQPSEKAFVSLLKAALRGEKPFPQRPPVVRFGKSSSDELTARELEVLQQLVNGKSDAEIAEALNCSVPTVKHHIQQMRIKTDFANRTQIAVCATVCGLVFPEY